MNQVKCPYCFSTNVTVVNSYETREVAVITCLDCGKTAEIDVENFNVDVSDVPQE